ncbi:DUF4389 domain-containing protein [Teredinibacter waterburyi]|uniref:DUF4389 domain-containing protein n=1 Tax=Teredinibacter waterburyi TaxID=1500538 RepID=UPI00165ED591|nr:DUF4389 domain-containing protein [Teredinibacter waterburyi]
MDQQLKSNLTSSTHWLRLVYMLLFAVLLQVALAVMWVLVIVQFLFALVTGSDNGNLRKFGDSLAQYINATIRFLTYNSEVKAFPFAEWPDPVESEGEESEDVYAESERSESVDDSSGQPVEYAVDDERDDASSSAPVKKTNEKSE